MNHCHICNKEVNTSKRPVQRGYYFHQVQEEDWQDLYFCSWECIKNHVFTTIKWRRKIINWLNKQETLTLDFTE